MGSIQDAVGYNDIISIIIDICNNFITHGRTTSTTVLAPEYIYIKNYLYSFLDNLKTKYEERIATEAVLFYHAAIPNSVSNGTSTITFKHNEIAYKIEINRYHIRAFGTLLVMLSDAPIQQLCGTFEQTFLSQFTTAHFDMENTTARINTDIRTFIDLLSSNDSISDIGDVMGELWAQFVQTLYDQIILSIKFNIVNYLSKNGASIITSTDTFIACWIQRAYFEFNLVQKTTLVRTHQREHMYSYEHHYFLAGIQLCTEPNHIKLLTE